MSNESAKGSRKRKYASRTNRVGKRERQKRRTAVNVARRRAKHDARLKTSIAEAKKNDDAPTAERLNRALTICQDQRRRWVFGKTA